MNINQKIEEIERELYELKIIVNDADDNIIPDDTTFTYANKKITRLSDNEDVAMVFDNPDTTFPVIIVDDHKIKTTRTRTALINYIQANISATKWYVTPLHTGGKFMVTYDEV